MMTNGWHKFNSMRTTMTDDGNVVDGKSDNDYNRVRWR